MHARQSRPRILLVNRTIVLGSNNQILLIRRSEDDSHAPLKWEFPGGKLDQGQDLSNALEREVLEETGLLVTPVKRIAYFESMILTSGKYAGLPYVVLIGISKTEDLEIHLSAEHQDYVWCSVTEALGYDLTTECRKALITLRNSLPVD